MPYKVAPLVWKTCTVINREEDVAETDFCSYYVQHRESARIYKFRVLCITGDGAAEEWYELKAETREEAKRKAEEDWESKLVPYLEVSRRKTPARAAKIIQKALGDTYGGPSISYVDGEFVLYTWTDAPVGERIIAKHADWDEFVSLIEALPEPS